MKKNMFARLLSIFIVAAVFVSAIAVVPASATAAKKADENKLQYASLPEGTFDSKTGVLDLTSMDFKAFYGILFPDTVRFKTVKFPATLETIEKGAFALWGDCTLDFSLCTKLTTIKEEAFIRSFFKSIDFSKTKITTIEKSAFNSCAVASLKLPATLTTIGDYAFQDTTGALVLDLSGTKVTSIGYRAFNSSKLKSIKLPATLATLGARVFSTTPALESIDLNGTKVSKLVDSEFRDVGAKWVSTGAEMKTIDTNSFAAAKNLATIAVGRATDVKVNAFSKDSPVKEIIVVGSEGSALSQGVKDNVIAVFPKAKVTYTDKWPTAPAADAPAATQTPAPDKPTTTEAPAPSGDTLSNGTFFIAPAVMQTGQITSPIRSVSSNKDNQPIMSVKQKGYVIVSKQVSPTWYRAGHVAINGKSEIGYMNALYVGAPVEGHLVGVAFARKAIRESADNASKALAWLEKGNTVLVKGIEPVKNGWLKVEYYQEGNENPITGYMNWNDLFLKAP